MSFYKKTAAVLLFAAAAVLPGWTITHPPLLWTSSVTENAELIIKIEIPEGCYQDADEKMFYITIKSDTEISIGKTVYPKAENDSAHLKYRGETILTAPLKTDIPASGYSFAEITLHYQLCLDDGLCFMPESEIKTLIIPPF